MKKRTPEQMKAFKQELERMGYKFADESNPIYTGGPFILFGKRIARPSKAVKDNHPSDEENTNGKG